MKPISNLLDNGNGNPLRQTSYQYDFFNWTIADFVNRFIDGHQFVAKRHDLAVLPDYID